MKLHPLFPQGSINKVSGRCMALRGDDIDTDRIIPARFLKCVNFEALGSQVFADDRKELQGKHPFDLDKNQGTSILIVNENFGCGSSREHAPQALMRWGIRAIIGQSFAEIFFGNCLALGIPCAIGTQNSILSLQKTIEESNLKEWVLDLQSLEIKSSKELFKVEFDQGPLDMLNSGKWDATSQLMSKLDNVNKIYSNLPYLNDFSNKIDDTNLKSK